MIVTEKLLNGYDLSLVIPISQLGILLASAGYIALGDPFKWSLIFGLFVLSFGAIMISFSAVPPSSTETMLSRFRKVPKKLWILTTAQALIFTISSMITYLGTKETARTEMVMYSLRRLHMGPVAFHNAFYFNLGQQFFSVIISTVYILLRKEYRTGIFTPIEKNSKYLLMVVCAYLIAEYAYFIAFMITTDTTILLALDNLSIPITLLFSFLILKEGLDRNKVIGSSLIVLGGVIAVL
jgi:drug/metabolite transporter (DMT)-like permease